MPPTGKTYRHRKTFDLGALRQEHRDILQEALNGDDRDWGHLVETRVPVFVEPLGRMEAILQGRDGEAFVVEADERGRARRGVVKGLGDLPLHVVWDARPGERDGAITLDHELFDDDETVAAVFMGAPDTLLDLVIQTA